MQIAVITFYTKRFTALNAFEVSEVVKESVGYDSNNKQNEKYENTNIV
jgi:hypothetical protein